MGNGLSFYPTIDQELLTKIGLHHTGLQLSYKVGSENYELITLTDDSSGYVYTISDNRNIWDPENHNITVRKEYILNNKSFLFGDYGICPKSGTIGLAIIWSCKGANSRGTIPVGEIKSSASNEEVYIFEHTFPAGALRNTLDIELIAYLKKRGSIDTRNFFASIEGLTLGSLDTNRVIIDGSASVFPIVTVEEPSQPLWWVNLDYDDPTEDSFSAEFISIKINKAHINYKKLESDEGIIGNPLLIEIMASSVQIIVDVLKASPYWHNISTGKDLEQGSIGEAIYYMLQTYELIDLSQDQFARQMRLKLGER